MSCMHPPVVVTRPQPEADAWCAQLQAAGLPAQALPLMAIGPSTDAAAQHAVQRAIAQVPHYRALMFVSANAVRYFFAHPDWAQHTHTDWQQLPRCWSPGPGTTRALLQAGVPATHIDAPAADAAQFDSESLWAQVQDQAQAGGRVLIVRGDSAEQQASAAGRGRAWLTAQLQAQQVQVDLVAVYTRHAPAPTPALLSQLRALHAQRSVWLFSSSDCIRHLCALLPEGDWRAHTALTTHPRIAEQAQRAGFGRTLHSHPTLGSIVASIKSLA